MKLQDTAGGPVHLGYCTNVHSAATLDDLKRHLDDTALAVRRAVAPDEEFMVGLWLCHDLLPALEAPGTAAAFRGWLADRGLYTVTVNAFPFGDFHAARVKEQAFLPDWADPRRLDYTRRVARVLAALLPADEEGSISTVPGGFKPHGDDPARRQAMARHLATAALDLAELAEREGARLVLCPEPEPLGTFETAAETVAFFRTELAAAIGALARERGRDPEPLDAALRAHLGVCLDVCHHAVQFEDPAAVLAAYAEAGIRVGKLQLSSAIEVEEPAGADDAVEALRGYGDDPYLHQVVARDSSGARRVLPDLPDLWGAALAEWRRFAAWRVHYHVPIYLEKLPVLRTTRAAVSQALAAMLGADGPAGPVRHLEIETYTWNGIPDRVRRILGMDTLAGGLTCEYEWALLELAEHGVYR